MKFKEELFNKYEIRKSKKQKMEFTEWVKEYAINKGYKFDVEKGVLGSKNIVIGDANNAKVIFTAHYDTCAVMPFPNFITPKNFLIYLIYQIILCFILFLPAMLVLFGFAEFAPNYLGIGTMISYVLLIGVCALIMFGNYFVLADDGGIVILKRHLL